MVEWITSTVPIPYETALEWMETRVAAIAEGRADEAVWLLEHPPLYTAGHLARNLKILTDPDRFPVYEARNAVDNIPTTGLARAIVYVLLDLNRQARPRCTQAFVGKTGGAG